MIKRPFRSGAASVFAALAIAIAVAAAPGSAAAQGWFGLSRGEPEQSQGVDQSAQIADLSLRVDRLEELVRRLTGEIEVLNHRLGETGAAPAAATSSQPSQYSAPQYSSQDSSQGAPPQPQAQQPAQDMSYDEAVRAFNQQVASDPGQTATYQGQSQNGGPTSLLPPNAAAGGSGNQPVLGAPERPLGSVPESALRGTQGDGGLASAGPAAGPAGVGNSSQPDSRDAAVIEEAYSHAYSLMIAEDYAGAETAFQTFISRYPGHELAGNAQYWLAESFYARGDYRRAAQEFLAGYETYQSSNKAPDSLLKLGMTLAALGQSEQACASLTEIEGRFPEADPAVLERARSERGRVGC